jgi:glycosyltransferase involved in cell wall biosynthesis
MMRTNIVIVNAPNDAQAICDVHGFLPRPVLVRNLPWWEPEISRDRTLLAQFDISSDAKTIVYLGGLTHGRGLPKLFEALKNIPVHLLIIGDGILRQELETLTRNNGLAEKIHFAGAIESNRAIEIVASCDAGICLVESISKSYELGLPSKIFEYMMCGIPIVANPLAQVKELFPNPDWLKYVDEKNIQSIEKGILDTLVNFDNSKIREQERNTALEKYHFECDAKDLARVLETFEK